MAKYSATMKITATSDGTLGMKISGVRMPNLARPDDLTPQELAIAKVVGMVMEYIQVLGKSGDKDAAEGNAEEGDPS